jgi:catechol 2,3-dioxygenase-like lactoylglutathione lyase family enzyme
MLTRFDHAVVGVRDLDRATALWRDRLGFDAQPGGRHTGRGTYNAIVRFGLDYVELISIYDRGEIEQRGEDNALALAALLERAEGGLLGFALATDDITGDALRFREAGFAVAGPTPMERLRPDGRLLRWRLLVPRGGSWGRPLPFFIQWDIPDDERLSWEQPGRHANGAGSLVALALTVGDLERWTDVYARQMGLEPAQRDTVAELGATRVRFRVGHTSLDLLAPDGPGPVADAVNDGHEQPWQTSVAVRDLKAAARDLAQRGVELLPAPGTPAGLLIPPADALGARIVLVEAAPEGEGPGMRAAPG